MNQIEPQIDENFIRPIQFRRHKLLDTSKIIIIILMAIMNNIATHFPIYLDPSIYLSHNTYMIFSIRFPIFGASKSWSSHYLETLRIRKFANTRTVMVVWLCLWHPCYEIWTYINHISSHIKLQQNVIKNYPLTATLRQIVDVYST